METDVIIKEIKRMGNGACVLVPKKYMGRKAKVIIPLTRKEKEEKDKEEQKPFKNTPKNAL